MAIQYCNYDIKGTLAVAGNATFSSSQIYLTGGLTSAVPSEYLGRVTGGGGGVMVGRTAAQVLSDIGAVAAVNEGIGIKTSGTSTDVTISVNYDSGDTDNLIFGSNSYTATVASKPYTPYILVADSNPGVSIGEVKNLRIQSIPINLLGDATGNVDMGGFRIIDVSDPSSAQDAATKAYVDAHGGGLGPFLPLTGGTLTGALVIDTAGGDEKMTLNNEFNTAPIADTFSGNTSKSYISFGVVAGSNDPGFIMHESSATETNEGVLHLCPSDDNSTGDYVSIHGSNDPDVLNLHTSGLIESVNLQLQLKSGSGNVYLNDSVDIANNLLVSGAATITSDLTVNGGDITLGGTGRIQGVDTVSSGTDAANKTYVDNAISGVPQGTVTGSGSSGRVAYWNSSSGITSDADLTFNGSSLTVGGGITLGSTSVGSILVKDSGTTYWQVFKSGSGTYITTTGSSSDSIYFGAPTSSVTTNLSVSGNIQTGLTGDGSLTLKQSGTMFMQMFSQYSSAFINTGINNSTIYFGNTTGLVQNVNVAGFLDADNFKINNVQGASGQVMTSTGSGVSWQTPTSGTVTGTGAANRVPYWSSATALASTSSFTFTSNQLYAESGFLVKGVNAAEYTVVGDTDTGLGSFDGANGVSLVSKGAKQITVKEGAIIFDPYTSTSVATTGSLNANQNNQAPSQDTLATLAVDPSGNVVRGEQEGTWTFTRAQLDATLGNTLIAAPGTNKAIIVTESDWMVKYNATGSMSGTQTYDVRQASNTNASAIISTLPGTRINEILSASQGTPVNPSYGFCARDVPLQTRTYKTNTATTLHKASNGALPTGVISISIKLKYRIFDATTF